MRHKEFVAPSVVCIELPNSFKPVCSPSGTLFRLYGHQRDAVHQQTNIYTNLLNGILIGNDKTVLPNIFKVYKANGPVLFVYRHRYTIHQLIQEILVPFYRTWISQVVEQHIHRSHSRLLIDAVQCLHLFHQDRFYRRIHLQAVIRLQIFCRLRCPAHFRQPFCHLCLNRLLLV